MSGDETSSTINFATFVLSLSSTALQHLGIRRGGDDKRAPETNLPLAQQTIDILDLLQQKTHGNLTEAEDKLLGAVLYDLRMRYVETAGKGDDRPAGER